MIPTHESNQTSKKEIIVNQLKQLNDYDFNAAHRHNYFEFFYFIKGGGTHKIDFIDFPIKEGSVHIVGPGQVHRSHCTKSFFASRRLRSAYYFNAALDVPEGMSEEQVGFKDARL